MPGLDKNLDFYRKVFSFLGILYRVNQKTAFFFISLCNLGLLSNQFSILFGTYRKFVTEGGIVIPPNTVCVTTQNLV